MRIFTPRLNNRQVFVGDGREEPGKSSRRGMARPDKGSIVGIRRAPRGRSDVINDGLEERLAFHSCHSIFRDFRVCFSPTPKNITRITRTTKFTKFSRSCRRDKTFIHFHIHKNGGFKSEPAQQLRIGYESAAWKSTKPPYTEPPARHTEPPARHQ